jgi:hypothetical protein
LEVVASAVILRVHLFHPKGHAQEELIFCVYAGTTLMLPQNFTLMALNFNSILRRGLMRTEMFKFVNVIESLRQRQSQGLSVGTPKS